MSIRRRSTIHDLAALCLHPDGSRVQQSSLNTGLRLARSTVVDSRGNWIARDAGGKLSKTRRVVRERRGSKSESRRSSLSATEDEQGDGKTRKGKQRAIERPSDHSEADEEKCLDPRTKRKYSFMQDLSFLDPPEAVIGPLPGPEVPHGPNETCLSYPASDLLKSIHHFARCFYREQGLIHHNKNGRHDSFDETDSWSPEEVDEPSTDEAGIKSEEETTQSVGRESSEEAPDTKNMYRAFDGSALVALGIVLQEEIAHVLSTSFQESTG